MSRLIYNGKFVSFTQPYFAENIPVVQPDWIDISDVSDNKINLLLSDIGFATMAFDVSTYDGSNYNVDWGDSSSNVSYTSGSVAFHTYTVGDGSICSLGYTTFKTVISSDASITSFKIRPHTLTKNLVYLPILSANFGTTWLSDLSNAFDNRTANCPNLYKIALFRKFKFSIL
jgi:hypothetical protein